MKGLVVAWVSLKRPSLDHAAVQQPRIVIQTVEKTLPNQAKGTARTTTTTDIVLGRKFAQMLNKPNNCMIGFEFYSAVDPFWVSFFFRV